MAEPALESRSLDPPVVAQGWGSSGTPNISHFRPGLSTRVGCRSSQKATGTRFRRQHVGGPEQGCCCASVCPGLPVLPLLGAFARTGICSSTGCGWMCHGTKSPSPQPVTGSLKALVAELCPTLCDPMDCSPPDSFVHGILQVRTLEWVAMPSSGRSS